VLVAWQFSRLALHRPGLICPASAGRFLCALGSLLVSARTAEPQLDVRFAQLTDIARYENDQLLDL
jgi:hypothetical protein